MEVRTLEAVSNKATWSEDRSLIDQETGERIDLGDLDEITIQVVEREGGSVVLSGSLSGGEIELLDDDEIFRWTFTASQMSALCAKTYSVGIIATQDEETIQILVGTLPVLDGIVT